MSFSMLSCTFKSFGVVSSLCCRIERGRGKIKAHRFIRERAISNAGSWQKGDGRAIRTRRNFHEIARRIRTSFQTVTVKAEARVKLVKLHTSESISR